MEDPVGRLMLPCPRCGQHSLIETHGSEGPLATCSDDGCEWVAGPFNTYVDLRMFCTEKAREFGFEVRAR